MQFISQCSGLVAVLRRTQDGSSYCRHCSGLFAVLRRTQDGSSLRVCAQDCLQFCVVPRTAAVLRLCSGRVGADFSSYPGRGRFSSYPGWSAFYRQCPGPVVSLLTQEEVLLRLAQDGRMQFHFLPRTVAVLRLAQDSSSLTSCAGRRQFHVMTRTRKVDRR